MYVLPAPVGDTSEVWGFCGGFGDGLARIGRETAVNRRRRRGLDRVAVFLLTPRCVEIETTNPVRLLCAFVKGTGTTEGNAPCRGKVLCVVLVVTLCVTEQWAGQSSRYDAFVFTSDGREQPGARHAVPACLPQPTLCLCCGLQSVQRWRP